MRLVSLIRGSAPRQAVAVLALLAAAAAAAAEVRLEVLPDGRKVIHNRGSVRSTAARRPPLATRSVARATTAAELETAVARHAARTGLDARLVDAVIRTESAYDAGAVSRKGAMGLMQLMPATAASLQVVDAFDAEQNLRGGTDYLRAMLDRFGGRLELALAAYNAGPTAVERFGGVPPYPETRRYVARVLSRYRGDATLSLSASPLAHRGRPTFLTRDSRGRIVMTTTRPASR